MINKKLGTKTEDAIIDMFREKHYWVYHFPTQSVGSPCDIIAIKGTNVYLIDAKHIDYKKISFPFSDIQPNQWSTMEYCTNYAKLQNVGFVLHFEQVNAYYWFPYTKAKEMSEAGEKSVKYKNLEKFNID